MLKVRHAEGEFFTLPLCKSFFPSFLKYLKQFVYSHCLNSYRLKHTVLSIMKILKLVFVLVIIFHFSACKDDLIPSDSGFVTSDNVLKSKHMPIKIAVVSDIHYFDPLLLKNDAENGEAFQTYLQADPKLIQFSKPIFTQVLSELKSEMPDLLLIPGDLTKDGEEINHKAMAKILQDVSKEGIKVYVIPGNHDVNNPRAVGYDGDDEFATPTVSAAEFASIYENFGYKKAKERDPNSLSYLCEPFSKLWILGIDDCKYNENVTKAEVSGRIKPETITWIQEKLKKAKKDKITVLAMMHHGIVEHYQNQEVLDKGYVTDDWTEMSKELMAAGVQVIFTGHYHANDITITSDDENVLYDVETGSLVTAPSPYRIATLLDDKLTVSSRNVTTIDYPMPGNLSFVEYSKQFLFASMEGYFSYMLDHMEMGLNQDQINFIAPRFTYAIMAHYAGDESISAEEQDNVDLLISNAFLYGALTSIWTDLPPADKEFEIQLK